MPNCQKKRSAMVLRAACEWVKQLDMPDFLSRKNIGDTVMDSSNMADIWNLPRDGDHDL